MLLVYTPRTSSRLKYVLDLLLEDLLGLPYSITTDESVLSQHRGASLTYADKPIGNEPFLYATTLLFERGIRPQEISVFDWDGSKAFFATHPRYLMPFDVFAASFYLVTRYEEYLPHTRDQYDRFDARQSLAFTKGFLHQAVVNRWANRLGELLKKHYPELPVRSKTYSFLSTIDIDNAWAFREKGLLRGAGAMLRSVFKLDFTDLKERVSVLLGARKDPYDTYDELNRIRVQHGIDCIYFFLLGDYDQFDKNVSASRRKFQSLIKSIADYHTCGIHPSFKSNDEPHRLTVEKNRLRKILRREVTLSRQHFLRLRFPETYRELLNNDISDDYTMGYAQEPGFRAGIASPYYFYDLGAEQATRLRIHPFTVMDATLRFYKLFKPSEVLSQVRPLIREVRETGGTFTILWHNESLSDRAPWKGWKNTYEEVVTAATTT
ncbi:MAG: hypothetical protein RL021_563 [Bacteroidota bacterium]|jgi:hypothetical protein